MPLSNNSDPLPDVTVDGNFPAISPIPFQGSLSVSEVYAAYSLAQSRRSKIVKWIARIFLLAVILYMLWLTGFNYYIGDEKQAQSAMGIVVFILFVITVVAARVLYCRRGAKQLWKLRASLYAVTEGHVDNESIYSQTVSNEETSNRTFYWKGLCGYRESSCLVVLYQNYPIQFIIMARSKFKNEEDWQRFLQLIREKLQRV